jgi:hypothetical protein
MLIHNFSALKNGQRFFHWREYWFASPEVAFEETQSLEQLANSKGATNQSTSSVLYTVPPWMILFRCPKRWNCCADKAKAASSEGETKVCPITGKKTTASA